MPEGTGYNLSFPTPDSLPEETVCRIFTLPADVLFLGAFMGALEYLTDPEHWQAVGSVSPEDSAQAIFNAIDAAYTLAEDGVCSAIVPAPYWDEDSGDDADDEAPATDQPWYGELVAEGTTWREQVGIWAISAFVAIAATPAAAIAFLPFANRFVLAFKQHSAGAIIKVLIDGVEMVTADTYAPTDGILNVPISLPAPMGFRALDASPPVLWVVMTDEVNPAVIGPASMQVIRKRLDVTDITPSNLRWNSDCDCVQQTPDMGSTWVDSPTQDPRSSTIFQVPARTGGDPKCDSAQQMHDRVKHMLDAIIASSDILQAINSVVAVIAVFFLDFGIIIEAIWAIVSAIFSVGTTTLNAALTEAVYANFLCILYCNIGTDGTVTAAQFAIIEARINSDIGGVAAFALTQALDSIGFVGLTNAGALGEVTGDCSACECIWCHTDDYLVSDGGGTASLGAWTEGVGWQAGMLDGGSGNAYTYIDLATPVPSGTFTVTEVRWTFTRVDGTFDLPITDRQWSPTGATANWYTTSAAGSTASPWIFDPELASPAVLGVTISSGYLAHSVAKSGNVIITRRTIYGTGGNPYGENNC